MLKCTWPEFVAWFSKSHQCVVVSTDLSWLTSLISSTFKTLIEEYFAVHYIWKKQPTTKGQSLSGHRSSEPICCPLCFNLTWSSEMPPADRRQRFVYKEQFGYKFRLIWRRINSTTINKRSLNTWTLPHLGPQFICGGTPCYFTFPLSPLSLEADWPNMSLFLAGFCLTCCYSTLRSSCLCHMITSLLKAQHMETVLKC